MGELLATRLLERFGDPPLWLHGSTPTIQRDTMVAKVQGSRSTPYKVEIRIPVFGEAEWLDVERAMAEQALFLAQLLAGEMPREIGSALRNANLSLGPGRFWAAGAIPRPVPTLSPRCDLLARQLGPSPVNLMGRDFADLLEELVTTAAKDARALLESWRTLNVNRVSPIFLLTRDW